MTFPKNYLLFFCLIINGIPVFAQTNNKEKMAQVERNLVGQVQFEGQAPWTIQERMTHYNVKGVTIAVIENYKLAWAKGYGWANDSLKIPVTEHTLFQAASISKSLNAIGVLALAQQQKLDLNADINNYLTSWKFPYDSLSKGKKINTMNLLSHTAGLTVHGFEGYERGNKLPTVLQILNGEKPANSAAVRSMYEPGLKTEYSGGGTTITQLMVTDITHQPYADFMKKTVLQPLGMTESTFEQPPASVDPKLLAHGYHINGKEIAGGYRIHPEQAPAGLWTNPTELAKYIIETQLAYEGKSAKVLNQKFTQLRLTPYVGKESALGVFIPNMDSTLYFSHSGANIGFRCNYLGSIKNGNGVIVMVNSDNGNIMSEIVQSVGKVYGFRGLYFPNIKKRASVPASVLQTYTGKYQLAPNFAVTVTVEDGQLYAQGDGQGKLTFTPETATHFFATESLLEIEFKANEAGKITTMLVFSQGGKQEAKRIE